MKFKWVAFLALSVSGCFGEGVEICGNGIDDDGDDLIDCEEALCRCSEVEICSGDIDEDGDGQVDCADSDCEGEALCIESECTNGADDDGDGQTDCDDTDCDGECPEVCDDGRDNDGDGLTDCEDADCVDADECAEMLCDDGTDDDGDGLTDCDDDDCWGLPCHPDGVATEIVDGSLILRDISRTTTIGTSGSYTSYINGTTVDTPCSQFTDDGGPSAGEVIRVSNSEAVLTNVMGVARVQVGSAVETCNFSFTEMTAAGDGGTLTPGTRTGLVIQDASRCRLAGTSWLPATLSRNGARLDAGVVRRYAMAAPMTRTTTASPVDTTTFRESCYRSFQRYTLTTSVYGDDVFGDELTIEP